MHVMFFDFVYAFAGKPRSTVELASRLRDTIDFTFVDPYGLEPAYRQSLHAQGFELHMLSPRAGVKQLRGTSRAATLWRAISAAPEIWLLCRRLSRAIDTHQPQLIWTSSFKGLAIAQRARGKRNVPILFHLRRAWEDIPRRGWRWRALQDPRTHIVCLARHVVDQAVDTGIDRSRLSVIPNAIDLNAIADRAEQPSDGAMPETNRPIRLLLPGTLVPRKGHCCAVRALGELVRSGHDAELWLAGDIPDGQDNTYRQTIQQLSAEQNVQDRVRWLGWRDDLPQLIRASTAVILPSSDEGVPRVLMEAMALQRPAISTPVGGTPGLIEHGRTGWLHPVDDPQALARCAQQAHDPVQREPIVAQAFEHLQQHHTPQRQRQIASEVFSQVAGSSPPVQGSTT